MKKILINASLPGELRVAEVHGSYLSNLEIENYTRARIQNNIYKGKISKVDAGIEVFFVDFGDSRGGFLPFRNAPGDARLNESDSNSPLQKGDELIVQVSIDKTEQEGKGAVLTTVVKLVGKYIVLLPTLATKRHVPGTVLESEQAQVDQLIKQLDVPEEVGISLRTSALSAGASPVQHELHALLKLWEEIQQKASETESPALLLREHNAAVRIMRDRLGESVEEVHVDTQEMHDLIVNWVSDTLPEHASKIKLHSEAMPIFQYHGIEEQVDLVHERCVKLPSGGDLLIDHTAAMTTIDINSSKGGGTNMEETALKTNMEAIKEIARQLRLRDIGGQIAIDLIDMKEKKNRAQVEKTFREYMRSDAGNPKIAEITEFCLLLMTRRRMRPSISDSFDQECPNCEGSGRIRNKYSVATALLREAQRLAVNDNVNYIGVLTSPPVCAVLLNDFRDSIAEVEKDYRVSIVVTPGANIKQQDFHIRAGPNEASCREIKPGASYAVRHHRGGQGRPRPDRPGAVKYQYAKSGIWRRLFLWWLRFGKAQPIRTASKHPRDGQRRSRGRRRGGRHRSQRHPVKKNNNPGNDNKPKPQN